MINMKLKDTFIIYTEGNDNILMDSAAEFSGMVHCNPTVAFILECLKTETTQEEIVAKMLEKYDADEATISKDVAHVLEELGKIGAFEGTEPVIGNASAKKQEKIQPAPESKPAENTKKGGFFSKLFHK